MHLNGTNRDLHEYEFPMELISCLITWTLENSHMYSPTILSDVLTLGFTIRVS